VGKGERKPHLQKQEPKKVSNESFLRKDSQGLEMSEILEDALRGVSEKSEDIGATGKHQRILFTGKERAFQGGFREGKEHARRLRSKAEDMPEKLC